MLTPLYLSENAPKAIRGALTGMYQFFSVFGIMLAFWTSFGCSAHLKGDVTYIVPLALQAMPASLLFIGMYLNSESPRLLAKQDELEQAKRVFSRPRHPPPGHPVRREREKSLLVEPRFGICRRKCGLFLETASEPSYPLGL